MSDERQRKDEEAPLTFWQTFASVLAAFFGVQSSSKRQRDFRRGRPLHFILIGLAATAIFVLVLVLVVRLVLTQTGV